MRDSTARARPCFLAVAGLAVALAGSALAQTPQSPQQTPPAAPPQAPPLRQFQVTRAAAPVKVDGVLDDEAWKNATVIDLPYEWFPGDNTPPPVTTEALVTYDSDNLYVAFRCQDPDPKA